MCRVGLALFLALYLIALATALVGSQGFFGTGTDGLGSVWLVFSGLPWTLALMPVTLLDIPLLALQLAIVVAPLINLWLLSRLCRPRG